MPTCRAPDAPALTSPPAELKWPHAGTRVHDAAAGAPRARATARRVPPMCPRGSAPSVAASRVAAMSGPVIQGQTAARLGHPGTAGAQHARGRRPQSPGPPSAQRAAKAARPRGASPNTTSPHRHHQRRRSRRCRGRSCRWRAHGGEPHRGAGKTRRCHDSAAGLAEPPPRGGPRPCADAVARTNHDDGCRMGGRAGR